MKNILCTLVLLCMAQFAAAQDDLLNFGIEVRADYQREYMNGDPVKDNCGFKGKYLNIRLDGNITDKFSYSYRQRLNKFSKDYTFFDATDWIYLKYQITPKWDITAGKLVVGIGGYEYDRAPIDLYITSEYWNNIPCYRFGVNLGFSVTENDKLLAQFAESPFRKKGEDTYGYSLMWYGSHGWFNTIYSVNMFEYLPGKYINYIALGNKFTFGDVNIELDYINRATSGQTFFFEDCSVIGQVAYAPHHKWDLFAKASYCVNNSGKEADFCVLDGTDMTRIGGGIEFYPLPNENKDLRLHLVASHAFGRNSNPAGTVLPSQNYFDIGVKWKMNLLSLKRKK